MLATLIRLLGDFDLAEEALHDAFHEALEVWPREGLPANPRAWLVSAGRFRAIDVLRRRARFEPLDESLARKIEAAQPAGESALPDDHLRLIFICCHPALPADARTALTLREVCGLTTEEIARAFLLPAPTIAQRIVRAKAKIREAGIPYEIPLPAQLPERLDAVLRVVYLVFNEGYSASSGPVQTRSDLIAEAIRLARLLVELAPEAETIGLLALLLLTDSRRAARATEDGEIVLLEDQDRSLWDRAKIAEGLELLERALATRRFGSFTIQAAIAALHAEAASAAKTDWAQIAGLYDALMLIAPSPVVSLNRAVAVAMRDGAEAGLALIDGILASGELVNYHLAHSARGGLCLKLGRMAEARAAYERALELTRQEPERRFLERRLDSLRDTTNRTERQTGR